MLYSPINSTESVGTETDLADTIAAIVIIVIVLLVIGWFVAIYNRLVGLRNRVDTEWADIDVQLRRRYDLIPNLVETVKGYAAHERETLQKVVEARQQAIDAKTIDEQGQSENFITSALRSIFALSEQYPDLKANQNFLQLQDQLSKIEAVVSQARQIYNESVLAYNNVVQMFPSNIVAGMSGFGLRELFEVTLPEMREAPRVEF